MLPAWPLADCMRLSGSPFPREGGRLDSLYDHLRFLQIAFPVVVKNGIGLIEE